jgi:hypothetical protein
MDTVLLLLKRGANVNAFGDFCIINAAKLKLYDIIGVLLISGADPFANESEAIGIAVSNVIVA